MAKAKPLPPIEVLREHFSYDPETGVVTRIKANKYHPNVLGPVGTAEKHGHLVAKIGGSTYKVHRLAWKLHTGDEPPTYLDHANGNPADNRWSNLRVCTHGQNMANGKRRSKLLPGVFKSRRKWKAGESFAVKPFTWEASQPRKKPTMPMSNGTVSTMANSASSRGLL